MCARSIAAPLVSALLMALSAAPAHAVISRDDDFTLLGVASIIYAGDQCHFRIDHQALTTYLDDQGLLTPEALTRIQSRVADSRFLKQPLDETACVMNEAVGRKIGVVAD